MVMVKNLSYLTNLTYVEFVLKFFTEKKINIKIKTTTTRNLAEAIPVTLLTYIFKVSGSNINKDLSEVCRDFCSLSWYTAMH